jgi:ABC-type bacteriocin/lantibiotic exporter with double-glycine peptidase domain
MKEYTKIKPIKQRDDSACGPASIQMACKYFDTTHSYPRIIKAAKYQRSEGMSNADITKALLKIGFSVREKRNLTWAQLSRLNTKKHVLIVSWMLKGYIGHFSVVDRITKNYIYLADPETGRIEKLEKIIFMRLWFDYDDLWYPKKSSDIKLRWAAIVSRA